MKKLVYLFELDSVRKYENPLGKGVLYTPGVEALLCEIIKNGNSVAITMNQLTDSQFIREALSDDTAYNALLEMFAHGALCVSLYGKIRTASQYIQQSLEKCLDDDSDSFVFSNLPVKNSDKPLLRVIRDALQFSDLSLLQEKMERASGEQKKQLQSIYRFVYMILQLSICETGNIPPKEGPRKSFEDFLGVILGELKMYDFADQALNESIKQAVLVLEKRDARISEGRCNRSNWLNMKATSESAEHVANKIVDLCYNYTVEDSINGVSKHYDDNDFENTFKKDLIHRIRRYSRESEAFRKKRKRVVSRSEWRMVVRFSVYQEGNERRKTDGRGAKSYETDFYKEKWRWTLFLFRKNLIALLLAFIYIVVFCVVELGTSWMEDRFCLPLDTLFVSSLLSVMLFGILGSLINMVLRFINRGDDIPDILASVIDILVHFCDFWRSLGGSYDSYRRY